jgi:hypothetical protein
MNVSRLLFAASLLLVAGAARAQLAANSPFLPPPGSAAAGPAENTPIELRGIMVAGRAVRFCIYDTVHKTSSWVGLNETGYDFLIKSQDLDHDSVVVEQGGRTFPLPLHETKVASSGQATAPLLPMPAMNAPNAITQSVQLNPTPADEQQRLEAVSAEVRRRRALRDQASQQNAAAVQTPPQPAMQVPQPAAAAQPPTDAQNPNRRRVRP